MQLKRFEIHRLCKAIPQCDSAEEEQLLRKIKVEKKNRLKIENNLETIVKIILKYIRLAHTFNYLTEKLSIEIQSFLARSLMSMI